jgi:hypothetical protein
MFSRHDAEYIETKSKNDPTKEILTLVMRDTLHNLDFAYDKNLKLYNEHKLNYIVLFEGTENRAYDDAFKEKKYKYADKIFAAGQNQTMQDLCNANKVKAKYVQLILRLYFLALKLKEAILFGERPHHIKLADIMQNIPDL